MRRRLLLTLATLAMLGACGDGADGGSSTPAAVDADRGAELFAANCAACHGDVGQGTTTGPPLVHEIYEPGHHADESFQMAVAQGVRAHHWDFGDMPPISGLDRDDVADITAWVREQQQAAGIE